MIRQRTPEPNAGELLDKSALRPKCPIPLGWTVRVYRSDKESGLAIHGVNERGREFTTEMYTDSTPGPAEVELPGERAVTTEVVQVRHGDEGRLAFLWERAVAKMRELDAREGA